MVRTSNEAFSQEQTLTSFWSTVAFSGRLSLVRPFTLRPVEPLWDSFLFLMLPSSMSVCWYTNRNIYAHISHQLISVVFVQGHQGIAGSMCLDIGSKDFYHPAKTTRQNNWVKNTPQTESVYVVNPIIWLYYQKRPWSGSVAWILTLTLHSVPLDEDTAGQWFWATYQATSSHLLYTYCQGDQLKDSVSRQTSWLKGS